jgi:DNA-binding response OmpR family regulator
VPPAYLTSFTSEPQRESRPLRILVVDDEPDAVVSMVALLRTEGFEAKGTISAMRAVDDLDTFDPDAVMIDLAMPGTSGWELAREVRKMFGKRPRLIAVSGRYMTKPDELLARAAGFDHFFTKPCNPSALIALLHTIVPVQVRLAR